MDIQKIISLVAKTQGLIRNREMASHVKEKGLADYVTQVDIAVQNFLKKERTVFSCAGHSISRRRNRIAGNGSRQVLDFRPG